MCPTRSYAPIQDHFHDVIRGRVAELVEEHQLRLPELEVLAGGPQRVLLGPWHDGRLQHEAGGRGRSGEADDRQLEPACGGFRATARGHGEGGTPREGGLRLSSRPSSGIDDHRRSCAVFIYLRRGSAGRRESTIVPPMAICLCLLTTYICAPCGDHPRLIDEWQLVPGVWNAVRGAVDDRGNRRGSSSLPGPRSQLTTRPVTPGHCVSRGCACGRCRSSRAVTRAATCRSPRCSRARKLAPPTLAWASATSPSASVSVAGLPCRGANPTKRRSHCWATSTRRVASTCRVSMVRSGIPRERRSRHPLPGATCGDRSLCTLDRR